MGVNRPREVHVEMTNEEKRAWERFLAEIGPGVSHREGMLRAAEAVERTRDRHPSLFDELWRPEEELGPF